MAYSTYIPSTDPLSVATSWRQTVWMPAAAMTIQTTSGAAAGSAEIGPVTVNSGIMLSTLDFDAVSTEFTQFDLGMNKAWDKGQVYFRPIFTTATITGSVVWGCQAIAFSHGDSLSGQWGTPQVTTGYATSGQHIFAAPQSSGITVAGTPVENDWVKFRLYREPANLGDNLSVDAQLIGVNILLNVNSLTDT